MSKMNWPPEKTIKYQIKAKEELLKEGSIEIPLIDGVKGKQQNNKETERG